MRVGHLTTVDYDFMLATPGAAPSVASAPLSARGSSPPLAAPVPTVAPQAVAPPPVAAASLAPSAVSPAAPATGAAAPAAQHSSTPTSELYADLLKLDDLRQRGLLTEEEFQRLKARLLAGK